MIRSRSSARIASAIAAAYVLALGLASAPARADWPERTVTMVVPFAAGGITDVLARLAAERLERRFKQTFIVENVVGATGTLAAARVARAAPDGYTLFVGSVAQLTIAPHTHKITYDPIADFRPISIIATSPFVITIGASVPANNLTEFIAYAKTKPGLTYGSGGAGSLTHLAAAMFTKSTGLDMSHVPYRGVAPAFQDLVAGHVAMMSPSPVELRPFLEKGGLKPLALTDTKRSKVVPDIPAITEFMPLQPVVTWNGLLAPARTPDAIINSISAEIMAAGKDPAFLERLDKIGVDPIVHRPEDFAKIIADETARWRDIIRDLGLKVTQ